MTYIDKVPKWKRKLANKLGDAPNWLWRMFPRWLKVFAFMNSD